MQSFPFLKLAEPSTDEIELSKSIGHEVVAISSINDTDRMYLKVLCRNGDETVIWLDAYLVDQLTRHFEKALMGVELDPSIPIRTSFGSTEGSSVGTVPRSLWRGGGQG